MGAKVHNLHVRTRDLNRVVEVIRRTSLKGLGLDPSDRLRRILEALDPPRLGDLPDVLRETLDRVASGPEPALVAPAGEWVTVVAPNLADGYVKEIGERLARSVGLPTVGMWYWDDDWFPEGYLMADWEGVHETAPEAFTQVQWLDL